MPQVKLLRNLHPASPAGPGARRRARPGNRQEVRHADRAEPHGDRRHPEEAGHRQERGRHAESEALGGPLKAGLNYGTLKPYIDALEKGGEFDDAEQIREAIRDNNRLARQDRAAEVSTTIKSQVGERVTARTQAQEKARADELSEVVRIGTEFVMPELRRPSRRISRS